MKHFPRIFRSKFLVLLVASLLLAVLPGCGHRSRPASSLSEKDRTTLAKYETIRAALVVDDLRGAKRAATALDTFLKPNPDSAVTPLEVSVRDIANAPAIDKARATFKTLSGYLIPLVDGVEGFYIMESPAPSDAEWVQTMAKVDNPYLGQPMRDLGSVRK